VSGIPTTAAAPTVQQPHTVGDVAGSARFRTDAEGRFGFWSIMPKRCQIPDDGPVGDILRVMGPHPNRSAHVRIMIAAAGHGTLITHLFAADSPFWIPMRNLA
jgi:hydroxyquinol 1,2-dioxygenase